MSQKYRIYAEKSNTIGSSRLFQDYNASQSLYVDLWYGGGVTVQNVYRDNSFSRHLMMFDLSEFQARLNSFDINTTSVVSYKLKMKNSTPRPSILQPEYEKNTLDKAIAQSFDLVAFPINKAWDEGRGIDIFENQYLIKQRGDLQLTGYSNWLSATSVSSWSEPGVFTNPTASTTNYGIQHFETGSEDIDMDITDMVKDWLSGGTTNYGLGLAYGRAYELTSGTTRFISSFYTHKTNSAFKPYIEVTYNQVIKDDRNQVTNNRPSRLYLYLFSGNSAVDYFSAGTISIKNSAGANIYTGLTPIHHSKGVYYVDIWMSGTTKGQKYKDVWQGVSFSPPYDQQDITQWFEIKDNYYTSNARRVNEYVVTTYGIDNNATIQTDEQFRIYIDAKMNYSREKPFATFTIQYKLTMNNNIELIEWTDANNAIINGVLTSFLDIDTTWLLTNQTYELTFRINDLGTIKVLPEIIYFSVVDRLHPTKR